MIALPALQKSRLRLAGMQKDTVRGIVAMVLAALIIGLTMSGGMRRGMNHTIAVSPGEQIALAIALSESVYGVNLGYVGLTSVLNTIKKHWNQGADGWSKLPVLVKNFHSRQVLNDGIRAAASLGPQKPGYFTDGSLLTTIYDDMGEVDYYKLSFALFGLEIGSLFYTFFLLLGLSAFVFILTFRDNVYALSVVLCTLFAFYVELHLAIFDQVATPTFFGMRHASTLALVPMWFFAFLLLNPRRPSGWLIAGALLELAILILAWRIRGSVTWMLMFLFLLSVVLVVLRRRWLGWSVVAWARLWPMLLRDTLRWPIVLLLLGLIANGIYNQQSRHLIYSTDDVIPRHGLWWVATDAIYEYAKRLDLPNPMSPRVKKTGGTPEGWWFLRDYLDRIHMIPWNGEYKMSPPVPSLMSPWTDQLKYRLVDNAMERIFFEAVARNPVSSVRVFLEYKIPQFFPKLGMVFINAKSLAWLWLIITAAAGVFGFIQFLGGESRPATLRSTFLVTAAAVARCGAAQSMGICKSTGYARPRPDGCNFRFSIARIWRVRRI